MRNVALMFGLCTALTFGGEQLAFKGFGEEFKPAPMPVVWNAPDNPVFYDHGLMLKQYGFGVLGSAVAGMLGFYIGNAFESAIFHSDAHQGYLSFTGIRFEYKRGPFWGGGTGMLGGSILTSYFIGESDEEQGSIFWTIVGGTATSAAAFALADWAGVQKERGLVAFIPLLTVPTTGAVAGYHISRWFNDKKRRKITEPASGALLLPPRLGFAPQPDGLALKLDAVNVRF